MHSFKRIAAVVMAAGIAVTGSLTAASPAQAAYHGCPDGYVCIYPGTDFNGDRPSLTFFTYGYHNLSNQFGNKMVVNEQTGTATVRFCTGRNGVGCGQVMPANNHGTRNFTPINSIVLARS